MVQRFGKFDPFDRDRASHDRAGATAPSAGSTPTAGSLVAEQSEAQTADGPSEWHAIWTRSRHEPLVRTELAAKGIDVFLPTVSRVSHWSDRTKRIDSPLFPGYCFARFEPDALAKVIRCTGVVTVLSNAGRPVAIPGFEIEALQRMMMSGLSYDPCSGLAEGSRVRVINGPLVGVVGRLERRGAQDQLILAIELLNSGARVQVSTHDVEPL